MKLFEIVNGGYKTSFNTDKIMYIAFEKLSIRIGIGNETAIYNYESEEECLDEYQRIVSTLREMN